MLKTVPLFRPETLSGDQVYLWCELGESGTSGACKRVRFVAYDPCPAVVIVCNGDSDRQRCRREDLYLDTLANLT